MRCAGDFVSFSVAHVRLQVPERIGLPAARYWDPQTEFLLASCGDDAPATGVLQLRFRFSVWKAAPDAWLEDLSYARTRAARASATRS